MTTHQPEAERRHRLKVSIEDEEVVVRGDRAGLEMLSQACLSVIGKYNPGGHEHFEWQNDRLLGGSVPLLVVYSDADEDFAES